MKNFNVTKKIYSANDGKIIELKLEPKEKVKKVNIFVKLFAGVIIGLVNGFFGGGGGMICVPILSQVIKLPDKKAHATTLLVMLPLCIASLIVYIIKNPLSWISVAEISGGFVLGGLIGAYILKFINNIWLGIIFSVIIIAGGVKMIL